ncbi:MAG: hypothetical protein EHM93_12320 [Bacteroidales bacterium]|nr:MAG: hypothetical protein EHM93_12320 [Bacteroidales bacterium]
MKEDNHILNHENGCITSDMLIKYIKGGLSGWERNRIERHISSCEMCSDELEGLSIMENPERVDEISYELNQSIDKLTVKPEREMPYLGMYLRIAASIVFIIGVSTVIYFTAFQNKSALMPTYAEMEAMDIASPSPLEDSSNDMMLRSIAKADKMENQPLGLKKEGRKIDLAENEVKYVAPVVVDSVTSDDAVVEVLNDEVLEFVVNEAKTTEVNQFATESIAQAAPASAERKSSMAVGGLTKKAKGTDADNLKEETENLSYDQNKEIAIRLYSKKKYIEALSVFDALSRNHADNDTLAFYTSLCTFHLNRFDETIRTIADLAKNPKSIFYNQAKWYYAKALIEAEKKEEAIVILELIIQENSPYKAKAKNELKKLKGN